VLAVAHGEFRRRPLDGLLAKLRPGGLVVDVKSQLDAARLREKGATVWRL
jgi:UDP-N-acetyl-D-glucosamine/UDP-N-acetyl-D-galactosamine dehydrogenase